MSKPPLINTSPITRFTGHYKFLSNFYMRDMRFEQVIYRSAEHAYQAQKMRNIDDAEKVRQAETPAQAKRLGNNLPKRLDWEIVKVDIMKNVLRAKFAQPIVGTNPLLVFLLKTGNRELVEGNAWGDVYWGQSPIGQGHNMLGKLLMKVRSEMAHLKEELRIDV